MFEITCYNLCLCKSIYLLNVAFRIPQTRPISVASGERSFSKLNRTNTQQNKLVDLTTNSIESDTRY